MTSDNNQTTAPEAVQAAAHTTVPCHRPLQPGGGKIAGALAKAQGAFPPLAKTKVATVPLKTGGKYSYSYADLADVMVCARPALTANGLAVTQGIDGNVLVTTLWHDSGEWLESSIPLVQAQGQGPQALGSTLTYLRRYGICALLAIVADEDNDAELSKTAKGAPTQDDAGGDDPDAFRKQAATSPKPAAAKPPAKPAQGAQPERPTVGRHSGWEQDLATEPQRKRMWALAKKAGYDQVQLKDMLYSMFGDDVMADDNSDVTTAKITKQMMDKVFKVLERDAKDSK